MANLAVKYLGLELSNPVIVSSSPLTASADKVALISQHGAGAVVLKSIFEEQITGQAATMQRYSDYPEAADYLQNYLEYDYMQGYLDLISECKRTVQIPVIASVNCTIHGAWADYARRVQQAGADAIELNIFILPTDPDVMAGRIEAQYLDIAGRVAQAVDIPVSVKLSSRFTNVLSVVRQLGFRKTAGVVMFNRYFEPDIDIENMSLAAADSLSSPSELRNVLRWVALANAADPQTDISVSTGVHSGPDAVKALLAGAKTVQVCSAVYEHGLGVIGHMKSFLNGWMERKGFEDIDAFRGAMNFKGAADSDIYQRAQFMRYFPR